MSENLKTIKELADELGVSKKKIHYQVSKLDSNLIQRLDGTIYLNNAAIKVIKGNIGYVPKTKLDSVGVQNRQYLDTKLDTVNTSLIDEKNERINYLKEQIKNSIERLDERRGIIHTRRHLAATPLFKGIPNFRDTRIAMLRTESAKELYDILDSIIEKYNIE